MANDKVLELINAGVAKANAQIKELGFQIDLICGGSAHLRGVINHLRDEGVEKDLGYVVDRVIGTLRRDPRMPKLSRVEWEQLLGDHYGTRTINLAKEIDALVDDDDDEEDAA